MSFGAEYGGFTYNLSTYPANSSGYVWSNGRIITEYLLGKLCKEVAVAYFKVISALLSEETEENNDKPQTR